jgi:uncharacterized protein
MKLDDSLDTRIFDQAFQYAAKRMVHDLPEGLYYHSLEHTRDDVIPALNYLSAAEGIDGESVYLLRTAAWFHDIGFVEQRIDHETISCRIASDVLPSLGFSLKQIQIINKIILVTTLPQSPHSNLENIMADADLDVLGRTDFLARNNDLRREFAFFGQTVTDREWFVWQLNFLETHKFFTGTARKLRDAGKLANIAKIQNILSKIDGGGIE